MKGLTITNYFKKDDALKEIKIGIVGCGAVTRLMYLPELPKIPGLNICYVNDIDQALARSAASSVGAKAVTAEEMLEKADAVIIATPPSSHPELIRYYMQKIRRIICEKPFVGTLAEAKSLVKTAAEKKSDLYVAHFRRCFPNVTVARSIIETGILGKITGLELFEGGRFTWQSASNYTEKDRFGGVLFDTGSHTVDMALFAAGFDTKPLDIAVNSITHDDKKPYHSVKAYFTFTTECHKGNGCLYLSRYEILSNIIRIIGEKGMLEFSAGLDYKIRLSGNSGSCVVTAEASLKTLMEPFRLQYRHIFGGTGGIFEASRFLNLTAFIEKIDLALGR